MITHDPYLGPNQDKRKDLDQDPDLAQNLEPDQDIGSDTAQDLDLDQAQGKDQDSCQDSEPDLDSELELDLIIIFIVFL